MWPLITGTSLVLALGATAVVDTRSLLTPVGFCGVNNSHLILWFSSPTKITQMAARAHDRLLFSPQGGVSVT